MRYAIPILIRVLSALLAVAFVAAGVVIIVEVAAAWLGVGWTVIPESNIDDVFRWAWSDRPSVLALAAIGGLGVVSLIVGLWRRPPLTVAVDGHPGLAIERRGLEQSMRSQLEALDGISNAKVRAGKRSITARLETQRRLAPDELKREAETVLAATTARYGLALAPDVRLRYRGGEL